MRAEFDLLSGSGTAMTTDSDVQFDTISRIHLGLAVHDVERSTDFYQILLNQPPTKTRPGYAKFEVAEPPVNLSLNQASGPTAPPNPITHYGIQVKSTKAVAAAAERLAGAGLPARTEENVTCCYAVQNKVWATDPDGNLWEIFVVLDNNGTHRQSSQGGCCADMAVLGDALARQDWPSARDAFHKMGLGFSDDRQVTGTCCGQPREK
jgi:catechol 2,3-dioxygenase-like lactoylglutathione lyase family enzyme